MRYRLFVIVLVITFLSACSFNVEVGTTDTPTVVTQPATQTSTATPIIQILPATETPLPPPTFTFTPEVPPLQPVTGGASVIHFEPGGTYVDVIDSIAGGSSKNYSVAASQGQVMSVSIRQSSEGDWVYVPMQVKGQDGAILCPPKINMECTFWRGTLPSTQTYLITLSPVNDVTDFTMRVAINPPGQATQDFLFEDMYRQASFTYTDEFAPVHPPGAEVSKTQPELSLNFIDTSFYLNTNLSEAYFLFGSSRDASAVQTCTQPVSLGGYENIIGDVMINGVTFTKSQGGGVAAGNIYEQTYYRAAYQGSCYEVTFFIHYGNIGAYDPGLGVKEFDRAGLMQKFESILSSLVIK